MEALRRTIRTAAPDLWPVLLVVFVVMVTIPVTVTVLVLAGWMH